jgi:hypothetical protein
MMVIGRILPLIREGVPEVLTTQCPEAEVSLRAEHGAHGARAAAWSSDPQVPFRGYMPVAAGGLGWRCQ